MVSPFVEGRLMFGAGRFALVAALRLPSLAAAELDRRDAFTPEALAAAERFALTDYLTTLAGRPPEGEGGRCALRPRVAQLTGVSTDVVARSRGFIGDAYLDRAGADGVASAYDAAFLSPDPFPDSAADDDLDLGARRLHPGPRRAVRRPRARCARLQDHADLQPAEPQRSPGNGNGSPAASLLASIERDLRELLALNPDLDVLVAHGRGDIVSPYSVSRYLIDHLPPLGREERVALRLYKGGHMFCFDGIVPQRLHRRCGRLLRSQASP